jgi:hypothetical protein
LTSVLLRGRRPAFLTGSAPPEQLADAAQVAQARLGLAADPAAHCLDRDAELAGGGLLGEALPPQHLGQPIGERPFDGPAADDAVTV